MTLQQINIVMKHGDIPAGQLRLIKPLYEAYPGGLSFEELSNTSDCSIEETRSTLGALGGRVTAALGKETIAKPSTLLIAKDKNKQYRLTEDMVSFIRSTPDFERALGNDIGMFFLHSQTASFFRWNSDKTGGTLEQFRRDAGRTNEA